jgi:plasmid replication initiation protein
LKTEKATIERQQPKDVIRRGLPESFPTAIQKSYFMLSDAERSVLNIGLQKYRPGQSEPILIGGEKMLKPALRLMSDYRLRIDEIKGAEVVTSYTRWLASVETIGSENQEVYVAFSPRFERIWLESKKRLPEYVSQKPANLGLRSQYALRLYALAKKYVASGTKRIPLEQLRKVLGLESVKDADGNIIQEAPLPIWANFRQRALDVAILEINRKTDIKIEVKSLERSKHRRVTSVTFSIQEQAVPNGD